MENCIQHTVRRNRLLMTVLENSMKEAREEEKVKGWRQLINLREQDKLKDAPWKDNNDDVYIKCMCVFYISYNQIDTCIHTFIEYFKFTVILF